MTVDLDPRWRDALADPAQGGSPTPAAWSAIVARSRDGDVPLDPEAAPSPRRTHLLAAAAVVALAVGALGVALAVRGDERSEPVATVSTTAAAATSTTGATPPRYRVWGRVEGPADGTTEADLCLGASEGAADWVGGGNPTPCSGIALVGWDWDVVGHEVADGIRSGTYELVGTYDGERFTPTEPARTEAEVEAEVPSPAPSFDPPCPTPAGGWVVTDPTKVDLAHFTAFGPAVEALPGYAGRWVDQEGPVARVEDVTTLAFTGDLEARRAEVAQVWGGPVCLVRFDHALTDLNAAFDRLLADGDAGLLGDLRILGGGVDQQANVVEVEVVAAPGGRADELSARYGVPIVLHPMLVAVG